MGEKIKEVVGEIIEREITPLEQRLLEEILLYVPGEELLNALKISTYTIQSCLRNKDYLFWRRAVEVKAIPVCIYCGKPFAEQELPEHLLHLPTIGEKLRYTPQCNCYKEALQKEEAERKAKERKELLLKQIEELYSRSNLTPRFRRRTLQSFFPRNEKQKEVLALLLEYVSSFNDAREKELNSFYLYGAPGGVKLTLLQV